MCIVVQQGVTAVAKRRRSDRFEPLRQQIAQLDDEISKLEDELSDTDIPPPVKTRLRELLKQRRLLRGRLEKALEQCEALGNHSILG